MYNCIQSLGRLPYTTDCGRFYAIQLKLLDPRVFLIPDGRIILEQHTVSRHVNSTYLRFFAKVVFGIL
ncbi:MAG: hypothetical protein IKF42_09230 [Mogibacterium sp.]|nr:hypothetical protein [Mogibacterium sp.]